MDYGERVATLDLLNTIKGYEYVQMEHVQKKEVSLRLMTLGEITMAQRVFAHSITYSRVWIHCDSYFPLGLQSENVAPNGELWYRKKSYESEFSDITLSDEKQNVFIHALAHVWQHQHEQWVRPEDFSVGQQTTTTRLIKKN